ncbi:Inactive ubiquitin thioesterase OTULINL [Galemys pyrenaicus]|uniref:Inactive ubiquitin thioesterase OTULINL n=1 Tax=Galemys pyrenaicus TaxID=202257 RepID=A0A8J6A4M0_GALPY|nr:Inactive ubiquitin thioesterase OTULINL [Galemys pyrenaicus]
MAARRSPQPARERPRAPAPELELSCCRREVDSFAFEGRGCGPHLRSSRDSLKREKWVSNKSVTQGESGSGDGTGQIPMSPLLMVPLRLLWCVFALVVLQAHEVAPSVTGTRRALTSNPKWTVQTHWQCRSAGSVDERGEARDCCSRNDQVHSWTLVPSQALEVAWRVARGSVMLAVSCLLATLCYFRRLHLYIGRRLKWWIGYLQRKFKRNLSVEAEVDLLSYCAREWKGETPRAKLMRKAYEELFWRRHIKCIRPARRDHYAALRCVLFQILSQGLAFPSWMKEKDIVKWTEFSGIKDHHKRGSMCNILFSDDILEYKLYEALKFIMLYQVTEVYEQMKTKKHIPGLFQLLFSRETSSDPLSFMMNHLNSVGDTCGLEQIDMFILGYSLEVKIKVFRLFKFNSRDFEVCYPEMPLREWPEISLLTENDRHYHVPVF